MAQQFNDNFQVNAPKDPNNKTGKFSSGAWRAYVSVSEAQTSVPLAARYIGLTQLILKDGVPTKYWYRDGITNGDLIVEQAAAESLSFLNGLREADGVVKLGADLATIGTTNVGVITEPTYILAGDLAAGAYTAYVISSAGLQSITASTTGGQSSIQMNSNDSSTASISTQNIDSVGSGLYLQSSVGGDQSLQLEGGGFTLAFTEDVSEGTGTAVFGDAHSVGFQYASDYSAQGKLNDRWIPDWGAVKSIAGSPLTFSNGLWEEDGQVKMGLNLTGDGSVGALTGDLYLLRGSFASGAYNLFVLSQTEVSTSLITSSSTTQVKSTLTSVEAGYRDTTLGGAAMFNGVTLDLPNTVQSSIGVSGDSYFKINRTTEAGVTTSSLVISDDIGFKGTVYASDYYLKGSLDDRWIPDLGAVKTQIAAINVGNGLSKSSGAIRLGGTIGVPTTLVLQDDLNISGRVGSFNVYGSDRATALTSYGAAIVYNSGATFGGIEAKTSVSDPDKIVGLTVSHGGTAPLDMILNDDSQLFGAKYKANYATKGKLNDRWIPDWGAVKSLVGSAPTLQSVTTVTGSNKTTNTLQITGFDNLDLTTPSGVILYAGDEFAIARVDEGNFQGNLSFKSGSTDLFFDNVKSYFSLREQSEILGEQSGAAFNCRISLEGALNPQDAVTLEQLVNNIARFEKIPFTAASGNVTIDFTTSSRSVYYPNANARAYNVSGGTETKIEGFSTTITKVAGAITSMSLDGITGTGYILITN